MLLINLKGGGGGVLCARREIMVVEAVNFGPTIISIPYKSCDVFLSFDTLMRSLRPLVWPQ